MFRFGVAEANLASEIGFENKRPGPSFVIERRPDRKDHDCERDELPPDSTMRYCFGRIELKSLTKDD